MHKNFKKPALIFILLLLTLAGSILRGATSVGIDLKGVNVSAVPGFELNRNMYGYKSFRVRVVNSSSVQHEIELIMSSRYSSSELKQVTRKFIIAANETRNESIFFPMLGFNTNGLEVKVDGLSASDKLFGYTNFHRNYYGDETALVDNKIPVSKFKSIFNRLEMKQFEGDVTQYNDNWLAYTPFSLLLFYSTTLKQMPSSAQNAVFNYLRLGGEMILFGDIQLPSDFKPDYDLPNPSKIENLKAYQAGFGKLITVPEDFLKTVATSSAVGTSLFPELGGSPLRYVANSKDPFNKFKKSELETVSAKLLMILIYAFALIIGPVNVYVLHKTGKKIWVFFTVPVVSLICCLLILGYYMLFERSTLLIKKDSLTFLDERYNRALTLGSLAVFSSANRPSGFNFTFDTEVTQMKRRSYRNRDGNKFIKIDGTQHFADGWIRPKIPLYLHLRKMQTSRERLEIEKVNGGYKALNGLGAKIKDVHVKTADGGYYSCKNLAAGQTGTLQPETMAKASWVEDLPEIYQKGWQKMAEQIINNPSSFLQKGMYVAVLDGTPFLNKHSFENEPVHRRSIVIGVMNSEDLQ
ncbi:MAG: hypothetical protein ACQETH_01955 [Candidatus Rifleibacteriota bacterium]